MRRRAFICLWLSLAAPLPAQLIATNISVADTFVRSIDPSHNYGGAGALAVSGPIATNAIGQQEGLLDSFVRFDLSAVVSNFDSSFGAGRWVIARATLNLFEQGAPNNTVFNRGVGPFEVHWIGTNAWVEGTGNPNAPTADGVVWNDRSVMLANGDLLVGLFTNGGTDGLVRATLNLPASFPARFSTNSLASFYFTAPANSPVGFTFHSRNFVDSAQWPFLEIVAVPLPRILSLVITGADITINFTTGSGITNIVEYTTNLTGNSWNTLTNVAGTGGNAVVVDSGAGTLPKRFYRVRLPVSP